MALKDFLNFKGLDEEEPELPFEAPEEPVKRPRGRPRKHPVPEAIDPVSAIGEGDSDKGASEAPGVRVAASKRKSKADTITLEGWAEIIQIFHAMLSVAMKSPELVIDDEEAKMLSKASSRLMNRYAIPAIPAWAGDWVLFAQTAKMVYGPRIAAISIRKAAERAARKAASPPSMQ